MYVPIYTTVINKTIVYSDTVLPLKDIGENLKVTSISGVNESSLESCLKIIFESNPNVIFNTIQYSKNDNKVYFYTNQNITTKAYEESKFTKYKPITSKTEILEKIKNILVAPKIKDNDSISLYDVYNVLKQIYDEIENFKEKNRIIMGNILEYKIPNFFCFHIYHFDYEKNELNVAYSDNDWKTFNITFIKQDEDLIIKNSETYQAEEILFHIGDKLSILYDEMLKYKPFFEEDSFDINTQCDIFNVRISKNGVELYLKNKESAFEYLNSEFKIKKYTSTNKYDIKANSYNISEILRNNENKLFKRTFVKIGECPMWMREKLTLIRQEQLAEEQKIEEEIRKKEAKKQKRLEMKRKLFPFLKK